MKKVKAFTSEEMKFKGLNWDHPFREYWRKEHLLDPGHADKVWKRFLIQAFAALGMSLLLLLGGSRMEGYTPMALVEALFLMGVTVGPCSLILFFPYQRVVDDFLGLLEEYKGLVEMRERGLQFINHDPLPFAEETILRLAREVVSLEPVTYGWNEEYVKRRTAFSKAYDVFAQLGIYPEDKKQADEMWKDLFTRARAQVTRENMDRRVMVHGAAQQEQPALPVPHAEG